MVQNSSLVSESLESESEEGVVVMSKLTIEVAKQDIEYIEELSEDSGFLSIGDGDPNIVEPHGDTLLHLLFFLIHTSDGRTLLGANRPQDDQAATADQARGTLKAAFKGKFKTIPDDRLDVVIDAHFAADRYVKALESGHGDKLVQRQIYEQKVIAILGALHDDAMGHEFSMVW
jgi:hypothetical protein